MTIPLSEKYAVSHLREPFCAVSHGAGALLALVGSVVLCRAAQGRLLPMLGCALYGVSLFALYAISALYHGLPLRQRALARFQRLDHIAIFVLIAGSYAPFCLVTLHGAWRWTLFGVEYGLATLGIGGILWLKSRLPDAVRVVVYVMMGWLIVAVWPQVCLGLPPEARAWLIAGGVVYSVGVVIFATDWPHLRPGKFSAHDLWHLFVLGGSACHFFVIWRWVV